MSACISRSNVGFQGHKDLNADLSATFKPNTNLYVSYGNQAKGFWGNTSAKNAIGVGVNHSF